MGSIQNRSKFVNCRSAPGGGLGVYLASAEGIRIMNLGFSVVDLAGPPGFYANTAFLGRIAAILGNAAVNFDPNTFGLTTNLDGFGEILLDTTYSSYNGFSSFTEDTSLKSGRGDGILLLMSQPVGIGTTVVGSATVQVSLYGTSSGAGAGSGFGVGTGAAAAAVSGSGRRGFSGGPGQGPHNGSGI